MKTHALFFLTLALICALFTAPAAALNPPPPGADDINDDLEAPLTVNTGETKNIATDISSDGNNITINSGGSLTINAGKTLTLEKNGGSTGSTLTINSGGTLTINAGASNGGTLTLSDESEIQIQEGGILIIDYESSTAAELNISSAQAKVKNEGIIVLKGTLTNDAADDALTSPGIILQYPGATPPAVAPSSGFVKNIAAANAFPAATIALYGNAANDWQAWHNDFLNGVKENEPYKNNTDLEVGPPAQITIGSGKELNVPDGIALTVKELAYKIASENTSTYQLKVEGTLTLVGSGSKLDIQSSAQLAGGGTISNTTGNIEVSNGATFDIEGKMTIANAAATGSPTPLTYNGGLTNNNSGAALTGGTLTIPANCGLTVSGAVTATAAITNNGTITISATAGNLTANGNLSNSGAITNNKTLSISNLLSNTGTITNEGSGELTISGGTTTGNLNVNSGNATITGTLTNSGTTTIAAGGKLNVAATAGNLTIAQGGILIIQPGNGTGGDPGTLEIASGNTATKAVENNGIIVLRGKLTNNAGADKLTSPGIILKYSTADASSAAPGSGFVKNITGSGSTATATIALCGTSPTDNAWQTWHNDFLNGTTDGSTVTPTGYTTPAAQLIIDNGKTLNVNNGVTLTANNNITNSGTINVSGTGQLTSAGTLTNNGGTITGGGSQLSIKDGSITSIINDNGSITSQGKLNVTAGNSSITGALTIDNGAQVNVSNSAQLTANNGAVIDNSGEIKVTGGTFNIVEGGNVTNQPGALIEITSPGTKTGGKLLSGFLVDNPAQTIEVSGTGNIWTSNLQEDYIDVFAAPIIALTCGKDYLTIADVTLEVPEGKTLTITHVAGTGANLSQTTIALTGEGTIDNTKAGALLALDGGLSLANITAAWPRQGFVQTAAGGITVIIAYGTDNKWSQNLNAAFDNIDTLVVPQNAKLDFSDYTGGLTIPSGSTLRLSGELACGANYKLTVTGTLYWGITGSIDDEDRISATAGKINYEMNPNWSVSFPNATEVQTYGPFWYMTTPTSST
jgi:hypothetical protein